jgi:transposase
MPRPRIAMRKVREVLRLTLGEGLSRRRTAAATGVPYTTVVDCLSRAAAAALGWPLPEEMDDADLERRLYPGAPTPPRQRPEPDWEVVNKELRRKGVTLQSLWAEYRQGVADGYQYTQFVHHYRRWARHLDVVLRQDHRAGEKLFIDFAGQTLPITDPVSGTVGEAQLFVAVLGASSYTYAEALASQELPHWIGAHVRTLEFMGGATKILVPDNLRSAVTRSHRYEPELNATYREMAAYYGCAVIPARARKPCDKAKVEVGVLLAERWILASLRHRTFFSLEEANRAIRERLEWLNNRPFQKLDGCRRSLFEQLERPVLRALPAQPYEYATWKQATVNIDYHVEVDHHYYSVPYQLARQRVDVRLTVATVEMLLRGRRGGEPPAQSVARRTHHAGRAYARVAPAPPGVDPGPDGALGGDIGSADRADGGHHPPPLAPPRAGLSFMPGNPSARQALRQRPPRGSLLAGGGARRLQLPQRGVDPALWPGQPAAAQPTRDHDHRDSTPARPRARRHLLPVTGGPRC